MRAKKQETRVLDWLKSGAYLTPMVAWRHLGVYRLADVIFKLRRRGHPIITETTKLYNKFGEQVRVARYRYTG